MYTKQEIFDKTLSSYYSKLLKEELAKLRSVTHNFITAIDEAIMRASDEGYFNTQSSLDVSEFNFYDSKIIIQEVYAYYTKLEFDIKVKIEADDEGHHRICVIISWDYK